MDVRSYSPGIEAAAHAGHVAHHQVQAGVDLLQRHRLHLRRRIHPLRRHLHLHLVADARSWGPASSCGPPCGSTRWSPAPSRRPAVASTPLRPAFCAIDGDGHRRIVQRLLDLHVAQARILFNSATILLACARAADRSGLATTISIGVGEPKLMTSLTMSPGSKPKRHLPRSLLGLVGRQAFRLQQLGEPRHETFGQRLCAGVRATRRC